MANESKRWSALEISKSLLFRGLTYKAAGFISKPLLLFGLVQKALTKSQKDSSFTAVAKGAVSSVQRLVRLVTAYAQGTYRGVSRKNMILLVASILYFVTPIDIVPDFLPIIGYLDDITLIGWIISTLGEELDKFESFERDARRDLLAMSYQDLYAEAKARDIAGRSGMSKTELVEALGTAGVSA